MKSNFKYYIVTWAVLVIIYNVFVFVTPNEVAGMSKFGGSFWVGYVFIMFEFMVQLGVAWLTVKDDDLTKLFYNIPLFTISYVSLFVMMIAGIVCMIIPYFPKWLGIIICLIALAFEVIALMQAQAASSVVSEIDTKVKVKTIFIKSLKVDVESLLARATIREISSELKNVYEAVKYSDPMSNDALAGVESQIALKISELSEGVEVADVNMVKTSAREVQILLNERNKKCKLLKK